MAGILVVSGNDRFVLYRRDDACGAFPLPGGFAEEDVAPVEEAIKTILPDADIRLIDELELLSQREQQKLSIYSLDDRELKCIEPVVVREPRPFNDHPRSLRETRRNQRQR